MNEEKARQESQAPSQAGVETSASQRSIDSRLECGEEVTEEMKIAGALELGKIDFQTESTLDAVARIYLAMVKGFNSF